MNWLDATRLQRHRSYGPQTDSCIARIGKAFRSLFSLSAEEASFAVRGFPSDNQKIRERLEGIGQAFVRGYNLGLMVHESQEVYRSIEQSEPEHSSFAVEGASMGMVVADALGAKRDRLVEWLRLTELRYTYLVHAGIGWAFARTPWRKRPILALLDPIHSWLAFDGLGFHDIYFHSAKILSGWHRVDTGYASRAYDQGIGRGLWFVSGGNINRAINMILKMNVDRRPDLWSGFGLALAYAGGASDAEWREVKRRAGPFCPHLAQGVAFAAEAHARAGRIPDYCKSAVRVPPTRHNAVRHTVRRTLGKQTRGASA